MDLEGFEKKKQICHITNSIAAGLILLLSAVSFVLLKKAAVEWTEWWYSAMSILFGLLALVVGCFLPKGEGLYVPEEEGASARMGGWLCRTWNGIGFSIISVFLVPITFFGAGFCFWKQQDFAFGNSRILPQCFSSSWGFCGSF